MIAAPFIQKRFKAMGPYQDDEEEEVEDWTTEVASVVF